MTIICVCVCVRVLFGSLFTFQEQLAAPIPAAAALLSHHIHLGTPFITTYHAIDIFLLSPAEPTFLLLTCYVFDIFD